MIRFISICLMVALGTPQMTRGKCCCTAERETEHLQPCCRLAIQRINQQRRCCCRCFAGPVASRPAPGEGANHLAADIGNDCDCGRFAIIQPGWRWSPRRELAKPLQWVGLAAAVSCEQPARHPVCTALRLRSASCATGPPLRVWHCVWVI